MSKVLYLLFIFSTFSLNAQNYQSYFQDASQFYKEKDYKQMLESINNANKLRPEHQTINYYLAMAYALNDSAENANYWLRKVISTDAKNYDIQREDFEKLKNTTGYQALLSYQKEMMSPIIQSDTAFVVPNSDLHIEDVAYNPYQNSYLLSSINKRNIYSYKERSLKPFFKNNFPYAITGMVVQDSLLWFTGAGFTQAGLTENSAAFEQSKLYKIDLKNGLLLDSIFLEDNQNHIFGDVVLTDDKQILVSDSKTNTVYRLEDGKLQEWINSDEIISLQGIVQIGNKLFLADYSQGLFAYNTANSKLHKIQSQPDLSLKGIDGLYAYNGKLVAIQNGVTPHRITYLRLNQNQDKVEQFEYLEKNHPAMGEPTLGYIENDHLIYVANSFWGLNENGNIKNENGIQPFILNLPLANFSKLNTQNQYCNSDNHRAFDFWLGNWEVYNENGDYIGTNYIHLIQNGCGIQENWTSKKGGAGTSYNFYNAKTKKWHQSWISNTGNGLLLKGNFKNGQMIMQSEELDGKIDRIKWVPQEDGNVFQIWEISTDGGKTWKEGFWGRYVKND